MIVIESKRWASVRKALGWSESQMWEHFAKGVAISIRVPMLRAPRRMPKSETKEGHGK